MCIHICSQPISLITRSRKNIRVYNIKRIRVIIRQVYDILFQLRKTFNTFKTQLVFAHPQELRRVHINV